MIRAIHLANEKKRDAEIAFEARVKRIQIHSVLADGSEKENVKILKTTVQREEEALLKKYGEMDKLARALAEEDPDVDPETVGKMIRRTRKLWVDEENRIAYRVNLFRVIREPDGTERERRDLNKLPGNMNAEVPLRWNGKKYPKDEAIRKFVFTKKYQIRHVNGVTFDFLYNMAKELHESRALGLVVAGRKGNEPILLSRGGQPYRGFLEGRVEGERYCLVLHLSDIELKELDDEAE